jgi:hypothetical protein
MILLISCVAVTLICLYCTVRKVTAFTWLLRNPRLVTCTRTVPAHGKPIVTFSSEARAGCSFSVRETVIAEAATDTPFGMLYQLYQAKTKLSDAIANFYYDGYAAMVSQLAKPGQVIVDQMTAEKAHLIHMAIGVSGEIGELIQAVYNNDLKNLMEECGDAEFYLEGIFQALPEQCKAWSLPQEECFDGAMPQTRLVILSAELLDVAKKYAIYNKELDLAKLHHYYHNMHYAMRLVYLDYGIEREEAMLHNADKLYTGKKARYGEGGYSDQKAAERADKADH